MSLRSEAYSDISANKTTFQTFSTKPLKDSILFFFYRSSPF